MRLRHDMGTKLIWPKMEPVDVFVNTVMNFGILEITSIFLEGLNESYLLIKHTY